MTILLREIASGWFYLGFGSWTPSKGLAHRFTTEKELLLEVEMGLLSGTEFVYEIDGATSFSIPASRFAFQSPKHPTGLPRDTSPGAR